MQHLSIAIPYRRSWLDRIFEACLLRPLVGILLPWLPRPSLPRDQLTAVGIQAPPDLDRRLLEAALVEIFRILTGGWNRLDRTVLDPWKHSTWSTPGATLFLSMHHGQWEWLAALLTRLRPDALCVAKAPTHPAGRWLLRRLRDRLGLRMAHDLGAVRIVHRHLRAEGLVAFLADQRPPGSSRDGSWMGHPTLVSSLPDRWIQETSPRIWTGVLHPFGDHYRLELREWEKSLGSCWDLLLDQEFRSVVTQAPWHHFGLWHHRLKPRLPRRTKTRNAT